MELMIAIFLSTVLTTGIVQLVAGSVSAYRLQLSQSHMEESSRYAYDVLRSHIAQAGYRHEPWRPETKIPALTGESLNGDSPTGDQLGLQRWSHRNCYGNDNTVTDKNGDPEFYILQTLFHVNASDNLAITCRYGPDPANLRTQINNFGLVEGVESLQVLYAEDRNGEKNADRWVTGRGWQKETNIRAVKVGLLLSATQATGQAASKPLTVLDETISPPLDGHLRKTSTFTVAIHGKL